MRAYTVHWRRFSVAAPAAVILLYLAHRDGAPVWFIANFLMLLVLLLSVRREQRGDGDEWPESSESGDYLRYHGGPLDGRPVPIRGELVGCEIVNSAAMLLPQIEIPEGRYTLNREKKRYDWAGSSAVSTPAHPAKR